MQYMMWNDLLLKIKELETESRFRHTLGVVATAEELSKIYHADTETVKIIALLHDCAKGREQELLSRYKNEVEAFIPYPQTLHAALAACYARDELKIDDELILNGIRYHCTGRPAMPLEEKIVFMADATEPGRKYEGVEELRDLAKKDLNAAVFKNLESTLEYVKRQGNELNPLTYEAYLYYKKEGR